MNAEELYLKHEYLADITLKRMYKHPESIAKKHNLDLDDLLQYAKTGLWIASTTYDENKSATFMTHAINHIRWHLKERLNRECCIFKINPNNHDWKNMYEVISIDDKSDENCSFHDIVPSDIEVETSVISNIGEEFILSKLTDRQIQIIRMKEKGKTLRQIAKILNMTHQNVDYHFKKIKKQLEKYSEVI